MLSDCCITRSQSQYIKIWFFFAALPQIWTYERLALFLSLAMAATLLDQACEAAQIRPYSYPDEQTFYCLNNLIFSATQAMLQPCKTLIHRTPNVSLLLV